MLQGGHGVRGTENRRLINSSTSASTSISAMRVDPDRGSSTRRIRFLIQQTALPKYRAPTFRRLADLPDLALAVLWGRRSDIPHVGADGFEAESSRIIRIPFGFYWQARQVSSVCDPSVDVVSMPWNTRSLSTLVAAIVARLLGKGVIMWGHGYSKHERALASRLRRLYAQLAHAVMVYNRGTRQRLIDQGLSPDRVYVALNSLDQTPIRAARSDWLEHPDRLEAFRTKHGLLGADQDVPVLLFVSRLEYANRADLVIRAAAMLRSRFGRIKAVIVGGGEERERLEALAAELDIRDHVLFTGPVYEEADLAPYFLCADVFCYPENIGLSILHAFGYGLPVVTSDKIESQNPEIEALHHGVNGLLYEHGSVDQLCNALQLLLGDFDLRSKLGSSARRTVLEEFTTDAMVEGIHQAARFAYAASRRGRKHARNQAVSSA